MQCRIQNPKLNNMLVWNPVLVGDNQYDNLRNIKHLYSHSVTEILSASL